MVTHYLHPRATLLILLVVALLIAMLIVNVHADATYTYTTDSPPTSQWIILAYDSTPSSVSANNTGTIPQLGSLAILNATRIGLYCTLIVNDACTSWSWLAQTGWYYDSANQLLYIHFLGGDPVVLSVSIPGTGGGGGGGGGQTTTHSYSSTTSSTGTTGASQPISLPFTAAIFLAAVLVGILAVLIAKDEGWILND